MPLILGHRGLSAKYLENSMEAFQAALNAGMDGFELDVQPTLDGVSMILHDDTLPRTTQWTGPEDTLLRKLKSTELPLLKNGEKVPQLFDALALPAKLINIELKGEPGWKQALAAVEACTALDRVLFSSFEHSEIFQLWSACPEARCGLLWEKEEALELESDELEALPEQLLLHLPLETVLAKLDFWKPYAKRLVIWDLKSPKQAKALGFEPYGLIVDGLE